MVEEGRLSTHNIECTQTRKLKGRKKGKRKLVLQKTILSVPHQ